MSFRYVGHRLDANQKAIRDGLEAVGASVSTIAPLDLLVGYHRQNFLFEVKTAKGKVRTPKQQKFLDEWRGQRDIVRTLDEALWAIGAISRKG